MPPPYAAAAQVRIVGTLHGSITNNVLNFATQQQIFDDPGAIRDQLIILLTAVRDCIRETLLPAVTADWRLVHVEGKSIVPGNSDPVVVTGDVTDVGELGPTSVSFAASLVNVRSGFGGRRGRGRMFLPPPGEPQVANSDIDAGTIILIGAFLTCLAARTTLANNIANFDSAFREALSLNPVVSLATMHSRKKGVGA
jgi:hypothetical protein